MVSHLSTKKMTQDLKEAFEQLDENGEGTLLRHEFINGYKKLNEGKNMQEVEDRAAALFDEADIDGTGEIDFGEWCTATVNKSDLLNDENLRIAFQMFDLDKTGKIKASEVGELLGHNLQKEDHVWKEVINEVDLNGDGQIDFEEFKGMMLKLVE